MTINERPVANPEREAIRNIKLMTGTMRGLMALADQLGEAQDLRATIDEKSAAVAKLLSRELELKSRIAALDGELQGRLDIAQAKANQIASDAADLKASAHSLHVEADARLAAATADAAKIIADARTNAKAAVADEIAQIKARL